jgi:hypothetical protein
VPVLAPKTKKPPKVKIDKLLLSLPPEHLNIDVINPMELARQIALLDQRLFRYIYSLTSFFVLLVG